MRIAQGGDEELLEGVRDLEVIGVLRPQVRVAGGNGVAVQVVLKRVQVLVAGPLYPAAVGYAELVVLAGGIAQEHAGKQVEISGVIKPVQRQGVTFYMGLLTAQAHLYAPLLELLLEVKVP